MIIKTIDKFLYFCSKRNHGCSSSKHPRICLACKMKSEERNWRFRRSNSHPSNHESCLTSELPTHWCTCKLLHCAIDPVVAFWCDYLSPAWMHQEEGVLSLGDARQERSLDVGLLKKIVAGKKRIHWKKLRKLIFSVEIWLPTFY